MFVKRFLKAAVFLAVLCVSFMSAAVCFATTSNSSTLLYKYGEKETLTKGVTYEKSSRLYKDGWVDVYILTMDMQNTNGVLDVIESTTDLGLKKTVQDFARENSNVIAAVNGDFFGSGNPMSSMGQVYENGKFKQTQNYYNGSENRYASFLVDGTIPFIDYVKSSLVFYGTNGQNIEIQAKNKHTDFSKAVYFDRNALTSTASIDKRVKGLYKLVVENNTVTYVSGEGETVNIPEKGYVIVMNQKTAQEKLPYFQKGQAVGFNEKGTFVFRPNKNLSEVDFGISGGGEILRNGKLVSNGLIFKGRNPRTVVGVDKDKKNIFIMCIDGRRKSIGMTHDETGVLMLEYGAYDAIHLDGGGSTTIVVKREGQSQTSVQNVPSDSGQRKVANALAIKAVNVPTGVVTEGKLTVDGSDDGYLFIDETSVINIVGYDEYHNKTDFDISGIELKITGVEANIEGTRVTPLSEGNYTLDAYLGGNWIGALNGKVTSAVSTIKASALNTKLDVGDSTYLVATAYSKNGFSSKLDYTNVEWSLSDPTIGNIENGKFTASMEGSVTVTAKYRDFESSFVLNIGKVIETAASFEENSPVSFAVYPENTGISGGAGITNAYYHGGGKSAMLTYNFIPNSTITQAAYAQFSAPYSIKDASAVNLWVKGDGSDNLLKISVVDAAGNSYNVDVVEKLDFTDWRSFTAAIPEEAVKPVSVFQFYVASLGTTEAVSGTVYIDDITMHVYRGGNEESSSSFADMLRQPINGAPESRYEDITVFGQTAKKYGDNINYVQARVLSEMSVNARAMYFVGESLIQNDLPVSCVQWNNAYYTTNTSNVSLISLATGDGNIRKANPDQWRWFQSYLKDFSKNNIVIGMDKNIWGNNAVNLTDSRERFIFHKILKDFVKETGKNVIVVSATGYNTYAEVYDGVRYINLNGLSSQNSENVSDFKYLRIRANADSMTYDIKNVF